MKKKTIKVAVLLILIAAGAVALRINAVPAGLDAERLAAFIEAQGIWAPIVFILIFTVAPTLLIPALPLTVTAGIIFGPFWGVVYVSIGSTAGATLAFLVARVFGRKWVKERIKDSRLRSLDKLVKKDGWKIIAAARLVPLFPYNLLNYAFGLTGIRLKTYVVTSFIFMLPATIAYVVFSSSIPELIGGKVGWQFIAGLALIIALSLLSLIYKKKKRQD